MKWGLRMATKYLIIGYDTRGNWRVFDISYLQLYDELFPNSAYISSDNESKSEFLIVRGSHRTPRALSYGNCPVCERYEDLKRSLAEYGLSFSKASHLAREANRLSAKETKAWNREHKANHKSVTFKPISTKKALFLLKRANKHGCLFMPPIEQTSLQKARQHQQYLNKISKYQIKRRGRHHK